LKQRRVRLDTRGLMHLRSWVLIAAFQLGCVSTLVPVDGGTASGPDASTSADSGSGSPGCDAGPALQACTSSFAGCTTFQDLTGATALITFGGTLGDTYSPACFQVHSGQRVTFMGDFSAHPLSQSCGPSAVIPAPPTGNSATFSFCPPGLYGFYCLNHGSPSGAGMAGAILVVP
jgi:plastocyanin